MKKTLQSLLLAIITCTVATTGSVYASPRSKTNNPEAAKAELQNNKAPLCFIENKGQVTDQNRKERADIQFSIKAANGLTIFIGDGAIHYQFSKCLNPKTQDGNSKSQIPNPREQNPEPTSFDMYRMDVELIGANKNAQVTTEDKQDYYENYFNERTGDKGTVAHAYSKITYEDVYPNIDWVLYIKDAKLEHEFVVRPGGNPADIKLKYGGATELSIANDGSLAANTPQGKITEQAPVSYQQDGQAVKSNFKLNNAVLSYETGSYTGTLIIDPTLGWATYYGGSGNDAASGVTTDATGNVYITGYTKSTTGIATSGAYQTTLLGTQDAFIAKLNTTGIIQWATYYGGSNVDAGAGIATDGSGNVYITGSTQSTDGIATSGSYQPAMAGDGDAFVAKFNSAGALQWGTYYGGPFSDGGNSIAADISGNVYIIGTTQSVTGIATSGAYQGAFGGINDAFIAKFNTSGAIQWATYYGGTSNEFGNSIATDGPGNVYIAGYTSSTSGITTSGAYQTVFAGVIDAFVAKFNTSGTIQWSTYYGGSNDDYTTGIATDGSGNVYITGYTQSTSGIATSGAYQTTFGGGSCDAFISKFNTSGAIMWATYYGGSGPELGNSIAIDNPGNIYITGYSSSSSGIATSGAYQTIPGGSQDAYLTKFNNSGTLQWATYYGGSGIDYGYGVTTDGSGNVYITGSTQSTSGIATTGTYQTALGGGSDGFLVQFNFSTRIAGTLSVCVGGNTTLTDDTTGGVWSSGSTAIGTIDPSSGIVTGITSGTTVISYTVGSFTVTAVVTVNPLPDAGTISGGGTIICHGATTLLTDAAAGGVWSSSATTIAAVGTDGTVTGGISGTAIIFYTVTNGCGTATATLTVTVSGTPGTITAPLSICQFSSGTATETVPGGTWTTATGNVVVTSTGAIFGASLGPDYIIYTVTSSCGSAADSFAITVNPIPDAGSISSTSSEICIGGTALFTDGAPGGSWSSATPYATVSSGGLVTGRSAGVAVISYTVSNGCGIAAATATILVDGAPDAGFISGVSPICISGIGVFSDGAAGGSWSSTVTSVATVDAYGDVSPASAGSTTISYTVTNACGSIAATYPVTIVGYPTGGTILGTPTVCVTSAVTLSDASAGGVWSISGGTATIGSSSGIVTGTTSGLALVTYTVTNLCGTASAPYAVSVDPLPHAGVVTGLDSVCRGSLLALGDTTAGGAWSTAGSGIATVSSSGTVAGLATGTETIIYTTNNMCGTATATKRILVNDVPVVPGISGATSVCAGAHTTLTDGTTGGTWHSTGSAATAAGGVITGVTADTVTITYSVTNSCGTTAVSTIVTVNIAPASNPILGPATYCIDELSHLYDSTGGGIWSISNGNAYLDATGSIAALTPGNDTITYVATNACGTASKTFVVTIYPDSICYPTGVQAITTNTNTLSVFPNPNTGSFTMQLSSPTGTTVHFVITNILGEKIKETDSDTNTPAAVTLNVAGGIYFVSAITADGSRYMQKVIVR